MKPRQKLYLAASISYGAAILMVFVGLFNPQNMRSSWQTAAYLIILLIIGFLLWGIFRWAKAAYPDLPIWTHPPFLIVAWLLFAYGIPGVVTYLDRSILAPSQMWITLNYNYSIWGMVLVVIGLVILWLGYLTGLVFFRPVTFLTRYYQKQPHVIWLFILFILSSIVQLIQIRVEGIAFGAEREAWGSLASFRQWIVYLIDLRYLSLATIAYYYFRKQAPSWMLVFMVSVQLLFGFSSAFMKPTLWLGLVMILAALAAGYRMKQLAWIGLTAVVLVVLVIPIAQDLREQYERGRFDSRDYVQIFQATNRSITNTWINEPSESWRVFIDKAIARQAMVLHVPGVIIQRTPELIPYLGIEQLLAIPAYLVPRALWPSKPVLSLGVWVSITYLGQPTSTRSASAMTAFGEGFLFYGWIGMILVAFMLGLLLAWIHQVTIPSQLRIIYIALLPIIIDIEGQFSGLLISSVQTLFIYLLFYLLVCRYLPSLGINRQFQATERGLA